ncbi:MAG: CBS domain-containing protein, partial [Bdellovibrionales bacterium]|nr:CBS domain-containing protein [Bdellovibrionales bacterium]
MISELEAVSILSELKGFARSTDDEPSRRILHELRAPVSALELPKLITLGPDMHLLHALRQMESEESRVAVIQETRDTILGAVSKRALEDLLCEPDAGDRVLARSQMTLSVDRGTEDSPVITMVMNRNVSIETSDATILEVVERMTVGACPFVVLVN